MLLHVESRGQSVVTVRGDALLYRSGRHYGDGNEIFAMSLVGNEQAIRAIATSCCLPQSERCEMTFTSPGSTGRSVKGTWSGGWWCTAHLLTRGVLHLVAISPPQIGKDLEQKEAQHLIMPSPGMSIARSIYDRLLAEYTTPLLPLGKPGQPAWEAQAAEQWMEAISAEIMDDDSAWETLRLHPAQEDQTWAGSGLLKISEKSLDKLITQMVRRRMLTIPEPPRALPASPAMIEAMNEREVAA